MYFTQAQARRAAGLSTETFRHWRKVIPHLNARQGRQAKFSFGDLVALCTLHCLIDELGLGISQFKLSGDRLFEACNRLAWIESSQAYILVVPTNHIPSTRTRREPAPVTVSIEHESILDAVTRASIVVPLDPIANALRASLFGIAEEPADQQQPWLPFLLTSVS